MVELVIIVFTIVTFDYSFRRRSGRPWQALGPNVDRDGRGRQPSPLGRVKVHGRPPHLRAHDLDLRRLEVEVRDDVIGGR